MSISKTTHCIVDDTALITNISEIEQWVQAGLVALIVPLHTLERLHLLKKDTSTIGANARKAVKFLDQITSRDDLPHDPVIIQGPEDQYATWLEVEAHYKDAHPSETGIETPRAPGDGTVENKSETNDQQSSESATLPDLVNNKLQLEKQEKSSSPRSTPTLSPSSSGLQSSKTSPEIKSAMLNGQDLSPVPQTLKALINPVVWYTYKRKETTSGNDLIFLTNSADTALIARDFGVIPNTIHQLRQALGAGEVEMKIQEKRSSRSITPKTKPESKTLFRYDEDSSDEEEEVVFKPRSRGSARPYAARGGVNPSTRSKGTRSQGHSPSSSMSSPAILKPQIPTAEIDPDSFDRGGFARGSTPLANVGNPTMNFGRGNHRGQATPTGPRGLIHRGVHQQRGGNVGRGRGRLFVP